jgi:hypothetical protein
MIAFNQGGHSNILPAITEIRLSLNYFKLLIESSHCACDVDM